MKVCNNIPFRLLALLRTEQTVLVLVRSKTELVVVLLTELVHAVSTELILAMLRTEQTELQKTAYILAWL